MNRDDWLYVGCKLIGVYFAVSGLVAAFYVIALAVQAARLQTDSTMGIWDGRFPFIWMNFVQPVVQCLAAYILIWRTRWCIQFITPERRDSSMLPPDLQS